MGIGDRIKQKRKEKRYTQAELGKIVSVSAQVISNWERGYSDPNHGDVARLAEALDCSTEFLHGRKVEDNLPPLNNKDKRDIAKDLENILETMGTNTALSFDGEPLDDVTRELVKAAIESNLNLTKQLAKKKFTPKKYRKD
ncbi:helix-turn-helix transcriptional regulator [Neobacillus sp. MM2021_6]|uniref:helix-turn-helix domain-containing protein n=1 Tax=Bacillaceae TaxID=186817 RepID=UPI00140E00E3|nr:MULTISPECIES: helix-turn-helix transcriptional regulator [Bacillaceae]MBO0962381.1 helix-turn-helix transcriptional regulator [Neobacillus sp. MM2021_6]NHC20861.1 helix-turn-helix transcriptional regulator [Bacillus sp. MM2020_4]